MRKTSSYILILLLWFTCRSFAQTYIMTDIPDKNGMPASKINTITLDNEGYIWYATINAGLCRSDGYRTISFRYAESDSGRVSINDVISLAQDSISNRILFGTYSGAFCLDKKNYSINRIPLLKEEEVRKIAVSKDGSIWMATLSRLFHVSSEFNLIEEYEFKKDSTTLSTSQIYEDSKMNLWVKLSGGGLMRKKADENKFQGINIPINAYIISIIENPAYPSYYVTTRNNGILELHEEADGTFSVTEHSSTPDKLGQTVFASLAVDKKHNILWCTSQKGVFGFKINSEKQLTPIKSYSPKFNGIINDITCDRNSNIWISSLMPQSFILTPSENSIQHNSIQQKDEDKDMPAPLFKIIETGSTRWLWRWDTKLIAYDKNSDKYITALTDYHEFQTFIPLHKCKKAEGVWASSKCGVLTYLENIGGNIHKKNFIDIKDWINIIEEGQSEFIYLATGNNIYIYNYEADNNGYKNIHFTKKLDMASVNALKESPDGYLYIASSAHGIGRYRQNEEIQWINDDRTAVSIAASSDSTMWIGTAHGIIYQYNPHSDSIQIDSIASMENGEAICDIEFDSLGHLWILCEKKVKEYSPHTGGHRIMSHNRNGINLDHMIDMHTENDKAYIAGVGGFCTIPSLEELDRRNTTSIMPTITSYEIDGERSLSTLNMKELHIKPDVTNLKLHISTFNYPDCQYVSFAYRLHNWDKNWTTLPQGISEIKFVNLNKGDYQLEVKATDEKGRWSSPFICLDIVRLPAWYETWWAYSLYTFISLFVIFIILRFWFKRTHNKKILSKGSGTNTEFIISSKNEELFIKKAIEMVNLNISNSQYGVLELSNDMNMSRMNLYRKLQTLTGMSPNEFIKNIRLKQAIKIMEEEGKFRVNEIAYRVGFSSASYFSKCFKDAYGMTPMQYNKKE